MTNQQEERSLSIGSADTVHAQGDDNPRTSPPKAGPEPLREGSRHRGADLESPGVSVKALGRSTTSHNNHPCMTNYARTTAWGTN